MELILGAAVSLFVQLIKYKFKLTEYYTLAAVLVLSVAAAGVYVVLVDINMWETVARVLVIAGAFYAYIIQRFQK